jgi:hypothetical protein
VRCSFLSQSGTVLPDQEKVIVLDSVIEADPPGKAKKKAAAQPKPKAEPKEAEPEGSPGNPEPAAEDGQSAA